MNRYGMLQFPYSFSYLTCAFLTACYKAVVPFGDDNESLYCTLQLSTFAHWFVMTCFLFSVQGSYSYPYALCMYFNYNFLQWKFAFGDHTKSLLYYSHFLCCSTETSYSSKTTCWMPRLDEHNCALFINKVEAQWDGKMCFGDREWVCVRECVCACELVCMSVCVCVVVNYPAVVNICGLKIQVETWVAGDNKVKKRQQSCTNHLHSEDKNSQA